MSFLNYKADGTPFWNQFFIAALRDANNRIVNFVGAQCPMPGPLSMPSRKSSVHVLDAKDIESSASRGHPSSKSAASAASAAAEVTEPSVKESGPSVKVEGSGSEGCSTGERAVANGHAGSMATGEGFQGRAEMMLLEAGAGDGGIDGGIDGGVDKGLALPTSATPSVASCSPAPTSAPSVPCDTASSLAPSSECVATVSQSMDDDITLGVSGRLSLEFMGIPEDLPDSCSTEPSGSCLGLDALVDTEHGEEALGGNKGQGHGDGEEVKSKPNRGMEEALITVATPVRSLLGDCSDGVSGTSGTQVKQARDVKNSPRDSSKALVSNSSNGGQSMITSVMVE